MTTFVAMQRHREGEQMSNASRQAIALAMALAITLAGVPLGAQAGQEPKVFPGQSNAWKDLSGKLPMNPDGSVDIAKLRRDLEGLKNSRIPLVREGAARLEKFLEIATTKSALHRSALIQELVEEHLASARAAKVAKNAGPAINLRADSADAVQSGPSADSGSNCYEGEPEPCATPQEQAELAAFLSSTDSQNSSMQSQHDSASSSYCAQYGCDDDLFVSGPNAVGPCADQFYNAASSIAQSAAVTSGAWFTLNGAVAAGLQLGAGVVAGVYATVGLAGFVAGYALYTAVECYYIAIAVAAVTADFLWPGVCPALENRVTVGIE
jgi:hypothetical protein